MERRKAKRIIRIYDALRLLVILGTVTIVGLALAGII